MRSKVIIGLFLFFIFLFCFSSGVSLAQDPGNADTVRLANISGEIANKISMPVFLYNDEGLTSVVIPLLVDGYSGWLRFDSVSYVGSRLADPAVLDARQAYVFGTDIFTKDSLLLSFSVSSGNSLPADTGKLCDLWFTLHFGGEVLVDSLSNSPQGGLSLTTSQQSFVPHFSSGLIDISCNYRVGDVQGDDNVDAADLVMFHKLYRYDYPLSMYPIWDRYGAADLNCDRRLDMRDIVYLNDYIYHHGPSPCTCGTINSPFYDDPGLPDTVWVESETLIVGISSPISIGLINDEPVRGIALALEWDGNAGMELDTSIQNMWTGRIDSVFSFYGDSFHADGANPDTFNLYSCYIRLAATSLQPGRDAIWRPYFIPQSAGTATFRLVSWIIGSESILVTEDHAAILPIFYGGNITVIPYLAGDANHDGIINTSDVVYLINYLFIGGPEPIPLEAGDANCDGAVNAVDVVYLVNYLFIGGPPPHC